MTRPNPVKAVTWTNGFQAQYKKLPQNLKDDTKSALVDLLKHQIPKSRRFEKLNGHRNPSIYTIHVTGNHSHKLSFEIDNGCAILRHVDTHKKIDRQP